MHLQAAQTCQATENTFSQVADRVFSQVEAHQEA